MTATTMPTTVPAASPVRDFLRDSAVYTRRNLEHIRQIPEKLMDVTLQPLMFVLLFAFVFGGAIHVDGGSYREYLIGGILVQSLAFGLMGPGVSIATDLHEGVIDRFRTLPASRPAYLFGHYLAELGGAVVSMIVLMGAGALIGWRVHTGIGSVAEALALLLLFATATIWIGTWIGMSVRSADAVQGIAFVVVFPITFVSSAFVPIESMPNALQWVASWNPISALVAAVRELFGNPTTPVVKDVWPMEHPVTASWIYCIALAALGVGMSLRRFRAHVRG